MELLVDLSDLEESTDLFIDLIEGSFLKARVIELESYFLVALLLEVLDSFSTVYLICCLNLLG